MIVFKNEFFEIDGFEGTSIFTGVKKKKDDMILVSCKNGAYAAGVFTQNITKAAPVTVSQNNIKSEKIYGLIANSGNANACTGEQGMDNCLSMCSTFSSLIGCDENQILVASTGIIGKQLEMDKIIPGINDGFKDISKGNFKNINKGIMTTDTFEKKVTLQFKLSGKNITLAGVAKGSGMIHPNMATMLGFVFTDANISKDMLQTALSDVVTETFNMVSVDGDTSTNDMVLAFTSCMQSNEPIEYQDENYMVFKNALKQLCTELSKLIAKDGEGATKLLQVSVSGCATKDSAQILAKSVISSSLVKAAFFGHDANWGRIICALGYSGGEFDPNKVDLSFESSNGYVKLMTNGTPLDFCEVKALEVLKADTIDILVDLKDGEHSAVAWGCDLTYDYVKINGEYRS